MKLAFNFPVCINSVVLSGVFNEEKIETAVLPVSARLLLSSGWFSRAKFLVSENLALQV
jgi:hypothetical protein